MASEDLECNTTFILLVYGQFLQLIPVTALLPVTCLLLFSG